LPPPAFKNSEHKQLRQKHEPDKSVQVENPVIPPDRISSLTPSLTIRMFEYRKQCVVLKDHKAHCAARQVREQSVAEVVTGKRKLLTFCFIRFI